MKIAIDLCQEDRDPGSHGMRVIRSLLFALAGFALPAASAEPAAIPGWVDVELDASGTATKVALVRPSLSPAMAAPIEQVVRSWTFTPGVVQGVNVPRTTSVALLIRLARDSNGKEQVIVEKKAESPRVLERVTPECLRTVDRTQGGGPIELEFTVNEAGRVVNSLVKSSAATVAQTDCALETLRATLFKPETLNGRPVASKVVQYFSAM